MTRRAIDLPILLVVVGAMVIGLLAGLARIGYVLPPLIGERVGLHGPILAAGVLGTLIALERAVAMTTVTGQRGGLAYLAPLAFASGTVGLLVVGASPLTQLLLVIGAAGLLAVNLAMLRMHPTLDVGVIAIGAAFLLVANAAWLYGAAHPGRGALVDGLPGPDHRGRAPRTRAGPSPEPRGRGGVRRHRRRLRRC